MPTSPLPSRFSTLAETASWTLEAACACGRAMHWSVRDLLRHRRATAEIGVVAGRITCGCCGRLPAMTLVEPSAAGAAPRRVRL